MPNPLANNWQLHSLITGIKRVKGQPPSQKLPITPDLLLRIHSNTPVSMPPLGPYAWFHFLGCCERAIFWPALLAHLIHPNSYSFPTWKCSPGVCLLPYAGAKPFSSGSGWLNSPYPSSQTPPFAQLLPFRGLCPLMHTLPNHPRHSCGLISPPYHSVFLLIPNSSSAFVLSSKPLVSQPEIMLATLFAGVGPLLPFRRVYPWILSRYWVIGTQMLFSFTLRSHCQ